MIASVCLSVGRHLVVAVITSCHQSSRVTSTLTLTLTFDDGDVPLVMHVVSSVVNVAHCRV